MPPGPAGDADALLSAFARWSAGARVRDEAAGRARERWLRQQASEGATLVGTLLDLAERHAPVIISSAHRRYDGRLVGVGIDLCVLEEPGRVTVVALNRVVTVQPQPVAGGAGAVMAGAVVASGDRVVDLPLTFHGALAAMAMDLAPVRIALAGPELLSGDLMGAGDDLVTLRLAGTPPRPAYIPVAAVEAFSPR